MKHPSHYHLVIWFSNIYTIFIPKSIGFKKRIPDWILRLLLPQITHTHTYRFTLKALQTFRCRFICPEGSRGDNTNFTPGIKQMNGAYLGAMNKEISETIFLPFLAAFFPAIFRARFVPGFRLVRIISELERLSSKSASTPTRNLRGKNSNSDKGALYLSGAFPFH